MQWLKWRQAKGGDAITGHSHYVEVTREQNDDFYAFKKSRFSVGIVELPCCHLLEFYNHHQQKNFPILKKYALCAWINKVKDDPCKLFPVMISLTHFMSTFTAVAVSCSSHYQLFNAESYNYWNVVYQCLMNKLACNCSGCNIQSSRRVKQYCRVYFREKFLPPPPPPPSSCLAPLPDQDSMTSCMSLTFHTLRLI